MFNIFDTLLHLNEQVSLVDWDEYADTFVVPGGICLNFLLFVARAYQQRNYYAVKDTYDYSDLFDTSKELPVSQFIQTDESVFAQRIGNLCQFVAVVCIAISVLNAYWLFDTHREYGLLTRSSNFHPGTPSAYREELEYSNAMTFADKLRDFCVVLFRRARKWLKRSGNTKPESEDSATTGNDSQSVVIWKLRVWDPSRNKLMLFTYFSPLHVLCYYTTESVSFKTLVYELALSTALYYLVFQKFLVLVKDKQLLLSETMKEYDQKFVKPRLSKKIVETSVDATKGPFLRNSVYHLLPHGRQEFKTFGLKEQQGMAEKDLRLLRLRAGRL